MWGASVGAIVKAKLGDVRSCISEEEMSRSHYGINQGRKASR